MREEVSGGQADGGRDFADIHRRVRSISRMQLALVTGLLLVANVQIALDWSTQTSTCLALSLVGTLIGIWGCAQTLASGLTARRYLPLR
jgi:hypothetical protein